MWDGQFSTGEVKIIVAMSSNITGDELKLTGDFLMLWKKSHQGPTIFSFLTGDNILTTFSTGEASGRPPGWI